MGLKVNGTVVGKEVITFSYKDKQTGKSLEGKRGSLFVVDGGRPIEVSVREDYAVKVGEKVELPVYVSVYVMKNGGAGFRLVHQTR